MVQLRGRGDEQFDRLPRASALVCPRCGHRCRKSADPVKRLHYLAEHLRSKHGVKP